MSVVRLALDKSANFIGSAYISLIFFCTASESSVSWVGGDTKKTIILRMPVAASAVPPHLELLTFLSDQNAQVRQVALSNLVGYSAKTNPRRTLLIDKHLGTDGKPLKGRDGNDVDTIQDLKRLCQDQPVSSTVYINTSYLMSYST